MRSSDLHWSSNAVQTSKPHLLSSCSKGKPSLLHGGTCSWVLKQEHSFCVAALCIHSGMDREPVRVKGVFSHHCWCLLKALFSSSLWHYVFFFRCLWHFWSSAIAICFAWICSYSLFSSSMRGGEIILPANFLYSLWVPPPGPGKEQISWSQGREALFLGPQEAI